MDIAVETLDQDTARIFLTGRLDISGSQEIEVRFAAAAAARRFLVVDLSGVGFLASIGVRTLFSKAKMMQGRGGRMVITAPQANVAHVLELTGVPQLISIFPDLDAARAHLAALAV